MKGLKFIAIIIGFTLLFSCTYEQNQQSETFQDWFNDPIRFIIENPFSPFLDSAVNRHTFVLDSVWKIQGIPPWRCGGNCLYVSVYGEDSIQVELDSFNLQSLREEVFNFLYNPMDSIRYSSQTTTKSKIGHRYKISKGHIYLEIWPQLNGFSKKVLQNICLGIQDYKQQLAQDAYRLSFHELDSLKQDELNQLSAGKLGLLESYIIPPPPPPPPFDSIENY